MSDDKKENILVNSKLYLSSSLIFHYIFILFHQLIFNSQQEVLRKVNHDETSQIQPKKVLKISDRYIVYFLLQFIDLDCTQKGLI